MALRSGLAAQIGFVQEVSFGVPPTVSRFLPLVSESLEQRIERLESDAIIAGRQVLDSNQWGPGAISIAGDVQMKLYDRGIGLLLKNMFGSAAVTGSDPYTHTFTPGDLAGLSLAAQVGRPDTAGTVRPFTYAGLKVASWEIACQAGEIATMGLSLIGKAEYRHRTVSDGVTTSGSATVTSSTGEFSQSDVGSPISGTGIPASTTISSVESATSVTLSAVATADGTGVTFTIGAALASASFPSGIVPFRYIGGTLTQAGSSAKVHMARLAGDNKLEERRFLGQAMTDEPYAVDLRDYTGELEAEFAGLTQYNRFVNGGESALVLAFAAGSKTLTFTANVRYDGTTPKVEGRGIVKQALPFKCVGTTDAAALTAVAVNSDSAV